MKRLSLSKKALLGLILSSTNLISINAQDSKLNVDISADLVSNYVWRGTRGAGASIQPSLSVNYGDLSVSAWGSTEIANNLSEAYKEVDFTASYTKGALGIAVTDYWWDGEHKYNYFGGKGHASHSLEGTLSYTLPETFPLSVAWNTFFVGQYDKKTDGSGDRTYSTYIELAYPFRVGEVDMGIATGFTPWESAVYGTDGFKFTSVQLSAAKEIKINDKFSLPVFASVIANPYTEDINFVFGITIK